MSTYEYTIRQTAPINMEYGQEKEEEERTGGGSVGAPRRQQWGAASARRAATRSRADYRSTSQTTAVSSRHEYEQSALNQILVKTANNIIDVSATDSHGMEQHEYMDRARLYSARVVMVGSSSHGSAWAKPPSLMTLTTQPFHVLASPLVSHSDITQVARFAAYASNAGAQVKVDHKEELVAHFNIP
ncbi:unnamed protein product [Lampetra planeri]